jgi:hypothetical protein
LDSALLEIPARVTDEPRWVVIGKMNAKYWSAMVTRRGDNVRIMKAKTFDRKFDAAEKLIDQLDLSSARRIGTDPKRVNVDFPGWMVDSLDREARRMGVTRQSLIKLWLAERLGQPIAARNRRGS